MKKPAATGRTLMKITLEKGKELPFKEAAERYGWRLCGDLSGVGSVCTDSREAEAGSLFAAIRGERVDGHDYIGKAYLSGCRAALCERIPDGAPGDMAFAVVPDTVTALNHLAGLFFEKRKGKVIGVTGSVGKTTTKEFVAAAFGKRRVYRTKGNFNSTIGFPLSVMEIPENTEFSVLEMGMSGRGEIALMSSSAKPDIAIITNVGSSHLELLGSRENIRAAKYEITEGLKDDGTLLINGDDAMLTSFETEKRRLTCGFGESCDIRAVNIRNDGACSIFDIAYEGKMLRDVKIPVIGDHNVRAALFGFAAAHLCSLGEEEIVSELALFEKPKMRQNIYEKSGIIFIEDCYNASPESMRAALDVLKGLSDSRDGARTVALLGDMLELGETSAALHRSVGEYAAKTGLSALVTFGELAENIADGAGMPLTVRVKDKNDPEAAADALASILKKGDILLVKASRGIAAERVIKILEERL